MADNIKNLAIVCLIIALLSIGIYFLVITSMECTDRGGVLVKGFGGIPACVERK